MSDSNILKNSNVDSFIKLNFKEIRVIKRTKDIFSHDSFIDDSIINVTSWRKSKTKFRYVLVFNILSFGILHILSTMYPTIYLKLYCKPSLPLKSDFFLIENKFGKKILCSLLIKKVKSKTNKISNNKLNNNINQSIIYNQIIFLEYNHTKYKYNEKINAIVPIYYNLAKTNNKNIVNILSDGLKDIEHVNKHIEKYRYNTFNFKTNIIYASYIYIELPNMIYTFISALIWMAYGDFIFAITLLCLMIVLINLKIFYKYNQFYKKFPTNVYFNNEYEVKRKYLNNKSIMKIKANLIVPGDVLRLKLNEIIPCDCVLLKGECIISESDIDGRTSNYRKVSLSNNEKQFNYKTNSKSILFQGSKIIKCHSEDKTILVLCINTGSNTYTANILSNVEFYYQKTLNQTEYTLFSISKQWYHIYNISVFFIELIIIIFFYYNESNYYKNSKFNIHEYAFKSLAISLMPIYHLAYGIIVYYGVINLNKKKICCVDASRQSAAGEINTIFFDKTGTLSEDTLEIDKFHPVYVKQTEKNNFNLYFKTFSTDNISKLSDEHLNYYKEYIKILNFNTTPNYINKRFSIYFLQTLVTCHNLEKINNETCGNILDQNILKILKWEVNNTEEKIFDANEKIKSIVNITEVYPKNYFLITEMSNKYLNSYKIKIYQRFYNLSTLNTSAIIYNCLDNSLRFMTKGPPEKLSKCCISTTLPEDIDIQFSEFRRNGYRVLICATKLLDFNYYDPENDEDYYLNGLLFCGFFSIKNNLKKDTKNVIKKLNKMNIDLKINTGDSIFNSIPVAHDCEIIDDKNIFIFDLTDKNDIVVNQLCKSDNKELKYFSDSQSFINTLNTNNNNKDLISFTDRNIFPSKESRHKKNIMGKKYSFANPPDFAILHSNSTIRKNSNKNLSKKNSINDKFFQERKKSLISFSNASLMNRNNTNNIESNFLNNFLLNNNSSNTVNSFFKNNSYNNSNSSNNVNNSINIQLFDEGILRIVSSKQSPLNTYNISIPFNKNDTKTFTPLSSFIFSPELLHNMKKDCFYCVSGKVFRYVYEHRDEKEYEKLLKYIRHICKIYFSMSSDDKVLLLNYFRTLTKKKISMIGNGFNDLDAIITSHVGIYMNVPKCVNFMLCHYYSIDNNLFCVEKIIKAGRAFNENSILLVQTVIVSSSIESLIVIFSFIIKAELNKYQLLIMNIIVFSLSCIAFKMKANFSIDYNYLFQSNFFKIYNIIKVSFVMLFKICNLVLFYIHFKDYYKEIEKGEVFISYLYILAIFQILSTIFSFNKENYFRKSFTHNKLFLFIFVLIYFFFISILALSCREYHLKIFDIVDFEYSNNDMDSLDDNHKIIMTINAFIDFFITYGFVSLLKYLMEKKIKKSIQFNSKKKLKNEDEEKEIIFKNEEDGNI